MEDLFAVAGLSRVLVTSQALRRRLAAAIRLDLAALAEDYGFDVTPRRPRSWRARLLGR